MIALLRFLLDFLKDSVLYYNSIITTPSSGGESLIYYVNISLENDGVHICSLSCSDSPMSISPLTPSFSFLVLVNPIPLSCNSSI